MRNGGKSVYGEDVGHSYRNYCHEFRQLFDKADKKGKGGLWEQVSVTNPYTFYALSEDKINKFYQNNTK
jgi:hypothetical protein